MYTSLTGKEAASTNALCANPADPCRLSAVLSRTDLAAGDTLAIMVSAAGAMVDVTDDVSVGQALDFQLYTNDGSPTDWVAGTLKFSGDLTITAAGVIGSEGDKLTRVIASRQVDITAGTSSNLPGKVTIGDVSRVRIDQTGTDNCLLFNELTIASRTQIAPTACSGTGADAEEVIRVDSSLTVNSELELLGDAILEVTAVKPAKKADQAKMFVEVNSSAGITSSGGMLRLSVMGYDEPNFEAWKDGDVRKDKPCFNVRGSGPIELDLVVPNIQYICVSVPSIGAGGTSTVEVGTVEFKGAIILDGNLVNEGWARTEFMGSLTITGDLTVDARFDLAFDGTTNHRWREVARIASPNIVSTPESLAEWRASTTVGQGILRFREPPILAIDSTGTGKVTPTKFPDHIATCRLDRRPGIHLNAGAMIEGDVKLFNIYEQAKPNFTAAVEADPDATPPVEAADAMGLYAITCEAGLFLMDKGMTIVEGTFLARETPIGTAERTETKVSVTSSSSPLLGGYVYLGGTTTLALEGDVDISDTFTEIVMNKAAGAGTITGCTASLPSSGAAGNKVIFSGSEFQTVTLSSDVGTTDDPDDPDDTRDGTLMLGALAIDKSGGSVELVGATNGGITATYLEPLNGALYTANTGTSLLGATSLVVGGGSGMVATNGTGDVYSASPTSVVYTGGNHTIGDERGSAATVTILSGGTVSMGKGSIGTLNLFAGTFKPTAEVTIGTLNIGNTGMLDLSGGSLKHTGLLHYSGNKARMAGAAWPASDAMPAKATDERIIRIQQDCGTLAKPTLHVDLNPGYTAVGGHLEVWRGTLDLNGNTLILESRKDSEQWVSTGNHQNAAAQLGEIINSKAGAAYEDVFERGDELFGALAALDEEYTDEKQAKLDEAIEALRPSGEAKALHGGGIVVGYLHEDAKKNAKTNLVIWREKQKLPAIKVRGGEVPILGSTHGAKGAQVTIPSLTIEGDKRTHVHTRQDVGRLQVTDSLTMSAEDGKLTLRGKENIFSSFKQTEGATTTTDGTADAMKSVVVTGMLTVGDSAKVTFGANGKLMLAGDVMSSGSVNIPAANMTTFNGTKAAQNVSFTDTLGSVTVSSAAGLMLSTDVTQAAMSELTLTRGVVATGDSTWMVLNPNIEADLAVRSSVPAAGAGTIKMGSRVSLVEGNVSRVITQGNTGSGNPKGGYLLPIGMKAGEGAVRNRYRPLILNFDEDLPATPKLMATASGYSGDMMMWPAEGMTVPSVTGTMQLDTHANIFWKLEMSAIPALAATIRVAADGLTGVNDPKGLRLIQWDCDGSNPRLAGEYDLFSEGMDTLSVSANARINGVPNSSIDGVALNECNVFGLAANHAQNPIGEGPPPATPMANVQLIHNIVGATVDVYVDDVLVADDFAFQKATSLSTQIAAGEHMVHLVAATAPDNSTPIASVPVTLAENGMYTVIANGDLSNFKFALLANARSEAIAENKVEFRVVHGAAGLGEVDLRSLTETGRWANNLSFNEATGYRAADATVHNVELLDGHSQIDVFEVDLGDYVNQTVVLALSGAGASSAMGLTLMGVDTQGNVFFPQVVTSAAGEELPTEFALQGNYPNPFNPSTQIQFDLPATAEVTVQVIDLLGRMVLTLPAQSVEAGANRTVELDGASLASGTYLYRLIADMESGVKVETGRMVLIK